MVMIIWCWWIGELRICYSHNNGLSWSSHKNKYIWSTAVGIMLGTSKLIITYAKRVKPYKICIELVEI